MSQAFIRGQYSGGRPRYGRAFNCGPSLLVDASQTVKMTLAACGDILETMKFQHQNNGAQPALAAPKPVSIHRAFVYSASFPGIGEIYAGRPIRGWITAVLFSAVLAWFGVTFFQLAGGLVAPLIDRLEGVPTAGPTDLPWFRLAVSLAALYVLWLWAVMAAVDSAEQYRRRQGLPLQASVVWAVILAWICPGAGNLYTGSKRYGYMLFAANLVGMAVLVPAYQELYHSLAELVRSGRLSPDNPYLIVDSIHAMTVQLSYSFGKQYQAAVKFLAIAGTIVDLSRGALASDNRWLKPSAPHGAGLLVLGWLCPGAGQHLQRRYVAGWVFLIAYVGSQVLIGILIRLGGVDVSTADSLEWLSVAIQWGAMLEAVLHMWKKTTVSSPDPEAK